MNNIYECVAACVGAVCTVVFFVSLMYFSSKK